MRRRDFISLFGGTAAAWSLSARAQSDQMMRLGVIGNFTASVCERAAESEVAQQRLLELSWQKCRDIHNDFRWSDGGRRLISRPG